MNIGGSWVLLNVALKRVHLWFLSLPSRLSRSIRTPEFWLTVAAYAIPLTLFLYVLYINFLPFGYSKTFVIDVGSTGDTNSSATFHLEPSRDLGERTTAEDGTTYRTLNGIAYAIFKPNVVLKDATITVSVEGDSGIEIIPAHIDFDPNSVEWDYSWDFTQGNQPGELGLTGTAFPFDGCMYFDGTSKLELPNSADKFESGPFTVYAEWTPENSEDNFQQIVGHYNWELIQNADSVVFQVGRTGDDAGPFFKVESPVENSFFGTKHSAMVVYSPSESGYVELYLDSLFKGRTYLSNHQIFSGYGNYDLSFGKSHHGSSSMYTGCLNKLFISSIPHISTKKKAAFKALEHETYIPLISSGNMVLHKVRVTVSK